MSESQEIVIGRLPVSAKLTVGSELLTLVFTSTRIIASRLGKRGLGEQAPSLLGNLAASLEGAFKGGKESVAKRGQKKMTPDNILKAHRDNFAISYGDIVSVVVEETFENTKMIMLTKDDKFEFSSISDLEIVVDLIGKNLRDKLTVKPLAPNKPASSRQ